MRSSNRWIFSSENFQLTNLPVGTLSFFIAAGIFHFLFHLHPFPWRAKIYMYNSISSSCSTSSWYIRREIFFNFFLKNSKIYFSRNSKKWLKTGVVLVLVYRICNSIVHQIQLFPTSKIHVGSVPGYVCSRFSKTQIFECPSCIQCFFFSSVKSFFFSFPFNSLNVP